MPRPDVTALLSANWHCLPGENGNPVRLMHHSQFGHGEDTRRRVQQLGDKIADAAQRLLERGGYTITHRDDPKPADKPDYKTAHGKCQYCGKELLRIGVDENMTATFSRLAARSYSQALADHFEECPRLAPAGNAVKGDTP